ncbi:MAG: glycosyltransferase family 2 protein [Candidatus Omnitrophota bacterium]
MKLSVLMPVYNEVNTIEAILKRIQDVPVDKEVLLVDDCSTEGTRQLLTDRYGNGKDNVRVFYHDKNMGKGAAVRTALGYACGEYSIIQDADLEYDPMDYIKLLDCVQENNADVVYGSRFLKTWMVTSFFHFAVNKFLTVLTNMLFKASLTDMETCYKLVKTGVLRGLSLKSEKFEIEPEITVKLLKKRYKIFEVPIFYSGRSYGQGKKITWTDGITAAWTLLKLRFSDI